MFCLYILGIRDILTWANLAHSIATFLTLHWIRGAPLGDSDFQKPGKAQKLTFWEQLDDETAYSPLKKYFFIVPAAM